jgi:hypothetical protein
MISIAIQVLFIKNSPEALSVGVLAESGHAIRTKFGAKALAESLSEFFLQGGLCCLPCNERML